MWQIKSIWIECFKLMQQSTVKINDCTPQKFEEALQELDSFGIMGLPIVNTQFIPYWNGGGVMYITFTGYFGLYKFKNSTLL